MLPRLRIRDIETIPLRLPFQGAFTFAAPHESRREAVEVLLVRIHTEEGLVGIGETQAWRRQGSFETLPGLVETIGTIIKPIAIGHSPFEYGVLMERIATAADHSLYAQAAVGDALFDLMGKALEVPLYQLLGGRARDKVEVGVALSITDPDGMVAQGEAAYEEGYRHLRIKIGLDGAADLVNVRRLREHFGDKVVLRADANGGLSFAEAVNLLQSLTPFGLEIVEQPVPGWDIPGMAALAQMFPVALSADESVSDRHSLMRIITERAASVIQTKTAKNGGIYNIRRLWGLAEAGGISIFPGNHPGTSVATAAVAHLCAAWPGKLLVGDFQTGSSTMIAHDIVTEPIRVREGAIVPPEAPGLGVELDEDAIARFRLDRD